MHQTFGVAADVGKTLTVETAAEQVRVWITSCENEHTSCIPPPHTFPKRVLDISGDDPVLVEAISADDPSGTRVYATLSHCWGGSLNHPIQTTKRNIKKRRQGIPWSELPVLLQDTIRLLRSLGIQFLWVDSLCIIQDDEEDWQHESVRMSDVYQNCYLNVAAVASPNSSCGLFQDRWHFDGKPTQNLHHGLRLPVETTFRIEGDKEKAAVNVRLSHQKCHLYMHDTTYFGRPNASPLLDRAWVFQELRLSPRTVSFASSEMLWHCRETVKCECMDMNNMARMLPISKENLRKKRGFFSDCDPWHWYEAKLEPIRNPDTLTQDVHDFWLQCVTSYSTLSLTKRSDMPYGIAGLAKIIQARTEDKYLAGLWEKDIPRSLLWCQMWNNYAFIPGIPTWSWMSRSKSVENGEGPSVAFPVDRAFVVDDRVKVHSESSFCTTANNQVFSMPYYGQIDIEGPWISTQVVQRSLESFRGADTRFYLKMSGDHDYPVWTDGPITDPNVLNDGDVVGCLSIGRTSEGISKMLVLKQAEDQMVHYRRVGTCSCCCFKYRNFPKQFCRDSDCNFKEDLFGAGEIRRVILI